ncbi:MAG: TetR/AcrR family transcriptional regulator [Verrucomicrobia bacterium]|nr:TetR/AcrR family transcriptional regulator [Verrucomicrobiota bacterium]
MVRTVKKSAERRADIVKAARRLFKTKEYEKATMQDVMDALGIAKGTIYHYFKSKEDLLEAVIEDIVEQNIQQMQALVKDAKGDALQKMRLLINAGRMASDNQSILDYLHKPGNYALHTRLLAAVLIKQAPLYAEVIRQGCNEGIFKTGSPLECAEFILSGVQFLTDVGIYPWTQEDLSRRMQAFPKLIEQQLSAPAGSFQFLID